MEIEHIAVVGAGTMGNGIAQVAACAGYEVTLYDVGQEILDRALENIERSLGRLVKQGKLDEQAAKEARGRIRPELDLARCASGAGMVIEAVPEIFDLKKDIYAAVEPVAADGAVLATNTSNLPITSLAATTRRPGSFIGMHWFNPPPLMKLIEIVVGTQTTDETLAITRQVSEKMGKRAVVCRDSQGFITTRALCAFLVECYRIHEEGLASAEDIDEAIRLGLNHPMGPLQLSDYIGLDTIEHICRDMVNAFGDRFRLPQSVVGLVRAGRHGVKRGRGFYRHDG